MMLVCFPYLGCYCFTIFLVIVTCGLRICVLSQLFCADNVKPQITADSVLKSTFHTLLTLTIIAN